MINADECYQQAEQKAAQYFQSLYVQVTQKTYIPALTTDIQLWRHNHIRQPSLFTFFSKGKKKPDTKGYHNYIKWLDYTGKLDNYLDRSISYIFMRDLGKSLDSPHTQKRILQVVNSLKADLTSSTSTKKESEMFSKVGLYRTAQKEGVESSLIWVMEKLKQVSSNLPKEIDANEAVRKLIKIIAGVIMQVTEEMDENISPEERTEKLDQAIRLGYSYGLTYPFIDDLLDAKILSEQEEKQYTDLIRTTLITGVVPEIEGWTGSNAKLIGYIQSELKEAFEYIRNHQTQETIKQFFAQSYVFFHSQEVDREKSLSNPHYTNEELYIPIILKSSSSRLIVRSVISASEDKEVDDRTFFYGIYNQLADDFADMFDDRNDGAVTPYTYYMEYHKERPDLINPFELYWTVISHLIHNVYHADMKAREVILDRAINGLKRFKKRVGNETYSEVMTQFASGNPGFNKLIQNMVQKADDVDFFDKLLRDHMITHFKNERKEQEDFINTSKDIRTQINHLLTIPKTESHSLMNDSIIDAANYSLEGDGKRLRPVITWFMGVQAYGLNESAIIPLLRSLEYMHTASLIFDDLPSQDNASTRRGRPTLHEVYNVSISELTGLFLTQKAIFEQTTLEYFDPKAVLTLIQYTAQITASMCSGQAMDLDAKGKHLTLEELNTMCFYKTGIGFEASLMMPAILANVDESEMDTLKKFARYAGIAFQIKDDLLDVEGDTTLLGKLVGKDAENNSSTFVSILGGEGAKKEMWENYCMAMEVLQDMPRDTTFLKHFLDYIVNRDR